MYILKFCSWVHCFDNICLAGGLGQHVGPAAKLKILVFKYLTCLEDRQGDRHQEDRWQEDGQAGRRQSGDRRTDRQATDRQATSVQATGGQSVGDRHQGGRD